MSNFENIDILIANSIEQLNENSLDGYIYESELWNYIKKQYENNQISDFSNQILYRKFLYSLHSSKSSLIFFESIKDKIKNELKWKLRTSIQEITVISQQNENNKINFKIEEYIKEIRQLNNEINQIELENHQLISSIESIKHISNPNILQNYIIYEKYYDILQSINNSFINVENEILNLNSKIPKD